MAETVDDKLAEGKLDLVPMIDCIMLLLLFFILTTKFTSEEKSISSLLPTDKGQMAAPQQNVVKPPDQINICIYPDGLDRGMQPSEYMQKVRELQGYNTLIRYADLRIGKESPIKVDGTNLKGKTGPQLKDQVEQIHQYIYQALDQLDNHNTSPDRKNLSPIIINCYSGLSWKYALVAYDAVRAYEAKMSGRKVTGDPEKDYDQAREVDFAPPRIRNYSTNELGNELYEIVNMK